MGSPDCPHLCLQPEELTHALEISNIVFTSMFALEMLLKLLACGPLGYIRNPYNIFDGIIVVIRWVSTRSPGQRGPGSSTVWQRIHLQSKTLSTGGSAGSDTALYDKLWEAGAWCPQCPMGLSWAESPPQTLCFPAGTTRCTPVRSAASQKDVSGN